MPITMACSTSRRFEQFVSSYLTAPLYAARASINRAADKLDELDVSPRTRRLVAYGAATLAGTAIASVAGLCASKTVVPALLRLSQNNDGAFSVFYGLPIVGTLLSSTLSRGGVLGAVTTSGVWLGVIQTLMLSEGGSETLTYWVLAHSAIGLAIAPLLLPGIVAGVPVLSAVASAALLTSHTLSARLLSGGTTWQGAIIGALGSLSLGPMGAQIAMGVAADAVIGSALVLGAAGAVLVGAYLLSCGWRTLTVDETALLSRHRVDVTGALSLDMDEHMSEAGVFGLPDALKQELKASELNLRKRTKLELRRYLFSGEPGTGKTLLAQGIAKRLGAEMFAPSAQTIESQSNPGAFVAELFEQARIKARKSGRPVVLFFDESERLFENRATLQHGGAVDRASHNLVLTFNAELEGVGTYVDLSVIVIAATNHESALDPSIRSRFYLRETLRTPLGDTLVKMFHGELSTLQKSEAVSKFCELRFDAEAVARWAARIESHRFTGRDIKAVVTAALRQLGAAFVDAHPEQGGLRRGFVSKTPVVWPQASSLLEGAVDKQIDRLLADRQTTASSIVRVNDVRPLLGRSA